VLARNHSASIGGVEKEPSKHLAHPSNMLQDRRGI
jgi:hypothetical protein